MNLFIVMKENVQKKSNSIWETHRVMFGAGVQSSVARLVASVQAFTAMAARDDAPDPLSRSPRSPVQQRLHDGFRADRRYLSQMVVEAQDERANRVEAVLELKQDLDASSARIAAQSAMIRARNQAEKEEQDRTHEDLVSQGKNPYEIARRKVVQRDARKQRARIDHNIQKREAKLLSKLDDERKETRRREKAEAENRAYERKYQREMGRAAQEERTNAYLLSRTGKETLDPTGKLVRVYPSQETTIKDNSFGLGRSAVLTSEHRRRMVSKVLSKPSHAGTEPSSLLLPRRNRPSQADGTDGAMSSSRTEPEEDNAALKEAEKLVLPAIPGARPGRDSQKVNHVLLPSTSDVKLPPVAGDKGYPKPDPREEDEAVESPTALGKHKKPRNRSVLEERQLAKARQRQHDGRFAQQQVVWGKAFAGNAFLANPQVLWFKDFDVGRPLSLNFTLTNVSNTFNQFRLLPMDDEVCELFDIVYERPGRMSAGMSCSIRMTFTGTERRDVDTTLSVAAPTGIVPVPVRCTCKKSVPVLSQHDVRFPEVVAGERSTIALTLANEGALPLEFNVRRIQRASESVSVMEPASTVKNEEEIDEKEADSADTEEKTEVDLNETDSPEQDAGEETTQLTVDETNDTGGSESNAESKPASRATSAASTKTSVTLKEPKETGDTGNVDVSDTEFELLRPDEQELLDRMYETTLFKPEGADEPIRFTKRGVVGPYSSYNISFTFAPAAPMTLEQEQYLIEFPALVSPGMLSPDQRRLQAIPITVSGVALQVPIYVAHPRLDFRCCAYGKLYRHQLVVCNRGKVALKLQVQVPTPLVGYVEFNPGFGFVQAAAAQDGAFPVQIKFRPQEKMWKRIERAGMGSRALGMLVVPVSVVVPDQVVPVFFLLTARLTPTMLQLSVSGLHFGRCCVGHGVSLELGITNSARVPQRVGITILPKDVTVADISAGVGFVLLPNETRKLSVVYQPSFPGELKAAGSSERAKPKLTLWSSTFNQEYTLRCSGVAVTSDLIFSHSVVRLGATALGQTQTYSVKLTNQSDRHTLVTEFLLPPEATPFLRVTPLVARLAPRESIRVEVDFEPTEDLLKLSNDCYFDEQNTPDDAAGDDTIQSPRRSAVSVRAEVSTDSSEEPRSCHHTWTVLCFQRVEESTSGKPSKEKVETPLQAFEVRTTAVEPSITASATLLDFGQVAIGQTLVRELELEATPSASESVLLRAEPLHVLGAFRVIGAIREVPASPESSRKRVIRVEFEPRMSLIYEDELELSAAGTKLCVALHGEGINPSLSLTPDGAIDFQDVLARTRTVRELVLANGSAFPLAFSIVPLIQLQCSDIGATEDGDTTMTATGQPAFTFSPTSAIIPAEGSVSVQVAFQPDHQRPGHYTRKFRVKVPNENELHIVNVSGRCWENQLYVFVPSHDPTEAEGVATPGDATALKRKPLLAPRPVEDLFDLPPSISLTQLPLTTGANNLPTAGLRKPQSNVILTFSDELSAQTSQLEDGKEGREITSGRRISQTLFIGSTAPSSGTYGGLDDIAAASVAAGGSAGTFELIMDAASPYASYFTLEPARGAIAAGQQLSVQVTYNPPVITEASALGFDVTSASTSVRPVSTERAKSARRRPDLEVVQWVHVQVQCVLKGGALWRTLSANTAGVAATATTATGGSSQQKGGANTGAANDASDTRIVNVTLRARLQT